MLPGKYDLSLYRGDSYSWQIRLWDDADQTDPTDLTGVTVAAEIRDKSAGLQIVALDCAITPPNIIEVSMTPDMYDACPVKGVWDLQLTYTASGDVHTVLRGAVSVTPDVTDSDAPG
jgi:hypothetical protein